MLDLDKLWKKLEDALAAETPESLTLWLDEQRRKDREADMAMSEGTGFLDGPNHACVAEGADGEKRWK